MTVSLRFQATILAALLCIVLFFALKQAILPADYAPPPNFEEVPGIEVTRMSPTNLEILLQGMLDKVRNGEAISYDREKTLKDLRQNLIDNMSDQPGLLARLLAMIDEIILLNDELIYPDDGESRTDEESCLRRNGGSAAGGAVIPKGHKTKIPHLNSPPYLCYLRTVKPRGHFCATSSTYRPSCSSCSVPPGWPICSLPGSNTR